MTESELLTELKNKKKLELVEPSEEISQSYFEKSEESTSAAKLLFDNKLYNDSISSAYYSIYNILISLFFRTGIKCENHTASLILLKKIIQSERISR